MKMECERLTQKGRRVKVMSSVVSKSPTVPLFLWLLFPGPDPVRIHSGGHDDGGGG